MRRIDINQKSLSADALKMTINELAEKYGCCYHTILKHLKVLGIRKPVGRPPVMGYKGIM